MSLHPKCFLFNIYTVHCLISFKPLLKYHLICIKRSPTTIMQYSFSWLTLLCSRYDSCSGWNVKYHHQHHHPQGHVFEQLVSQLLALFGKIIVFWMWNKARKGGTMRVGLESYWLALLPTQTLCFLVYQVMRSPSCMIHPL